MSKEVSDDELARAFQDEIEPDLYMAFKAGLIGRDAQLRSTSVVALVGVLLVGLLIGILVGVYIIA